MQVVMVGETKTNLLVIASCSQWVNILALLQ